MVYGVHDVDPLSSESVLDVAKNGQHRAATDLEGSRQKQQDRLVKAKLHSQTVRLREAFLRIDGRITGTIPTYMVPACLKAGGLSLNAQETIDAATEFMTGEGVSTGSSSAIRLRRHAPSNGPRQAASSLPKRSLRLMRMARGNSHVTKSRGRSRAQCASAQRKARQHCQEL